MHFALIYSSVKGSEFLMSIPVKDFEEVPKENWLENYPRASITIMAGMLNMTRENSGQVKSYFKVLLILGRKNCIRNGKEVQIL